MQMTQPLYRLDYRGDDVPEYLPEEAVAAILAVAYRSPVMVNPLLQALRSGQRVRVPAGVLQLCTRTSTLGSTLRIELKAKNYQLHPSDSPRQPRTPTSYRPRSEFRLTFLVVPVRYSRWHD